MNFLVHEALFVQNQICFNHFNNENFIPVESLTFRS